jgi:hypothetical protein
LLANNPNPTDNGLASEPLNVFAVMVPVVLILLKLPVPPFTVVALTVFAVAVPVIAALDKLAVVALMVVP